MKFGRVLKQHMHPPWAAHYIDYPRLKRTVYTTECVQGADPALVNEHARESALDSYVQLFMGELDEEIERVSAFYQSSAAELRAQLSQLQAEQQSVGASESMIEALREVGRTAVLLVQFLELNLTGLRKILKKHEKRITGHPVAARYLSARRDKEHALQKLNAHVELDEIYDAVRDAIDGARNELEVQRALAPDGASARRLAPAAKPAGCAASAHGTRALSPASREALDARVQALEGGAVARTPARAAHAPLGRQLSIYAHEPVLREMADSLRELKHASRFVNTLVVSLAETSGITADEGQGMRKSDSKLALALNLLSTFIFMLNYYIILPSSGAYCMALGAPPSFSGIVVGVLPAAACLAAVVYSFATQFSYRAPLLASAALCSVGNVAYALALPYGSLKLMLCGRILVGMGGARVVNRRYIADHVDLEYRTEASAAFVAFTALGMAVGPGVAAVVAALPETEVYGLPINGLTAPGFAMLLFWLPYLAAVAIAFVEPPLYRAQPAQGTSAHDGARGGGHGAGAARAHAAARGGSAAAPLLPRGAPEDVAAAACACGGAAGSPPRTARAQLSALSSASKVSNFGDAESVPLLTIERAPGGEASRPRLVVVLALLWLYLLDKLLGEAWLTSVPIVARAQFEWSEQRVGLFLCVVSGLVLPASHVCSIAFATVATHERERTIIAVMMCTVLLGGGLLLCVARPFASAASYVAGAVIFFVSTNLLEAAAMSLLSKKMPRQWAAGVLNSGFLTTVTGLGGRVIGNLLVTLLGGVVGARRLDTVLLVPLFAAWLVSMLLFCAGFRRFSTA